MSGRMNVPAAQEMRFSPAPGKKSPAVSDAAKATVQRDLLLKERVPVPGLNALTAFRIIIVARFCGAMYSSISDCDEGELGSHVGLALWHMLTSLTYMAD